MRVLVVNAGSSTLKLSRLDDGELVGAQEIPTPEPDLDAELLATAIGQLGPVDAVGHRIVHGGDRFSQAVKVDAEVLTGLWQLTDLAPLHQARALTALEAVRRIRPDWPAVACFDTAFHATIPPEASTYAIPRAWQQQWGLRRFGFHGLSHAYAAHRSAELLRRPMDQLRIVTCHLGAGASLAAVDRGRSVDTTMGFTPLEGLVMATRSGSVDPGMLLWLLEQTDMTVQQVGHALEHESGLLALTSTADMRVTIKRAAAGDSDAQLGLDVYLHRLSAAIAAMAAAMNGVDIVAWTGGVGEHAPAIRAAATDRLRFLGLEIVPSTNQAAAGDCDLTAVGAGVASVVVSAREDIEIARQVRTLLA